MIEPNLKPRGGHNVSLESQAEESAPPQVVVCDCFESCNRPGGDEGRYWRQAERRKVKPITLRGEERGEAGMRNDTPAPVVNLA